MQAALNAVASGESMRKAGILFNIPFSTIKDRVKEDKCYVPSLGKKVNFQRRTQKRDRKACFVACKTIFWYHAY
jgi:hypothetical protein